VTRRAVITGLGIVSPIGIGAEAFWRSALAGRSGIGRPTLFDASKLPPECQIVGEVRGFDARDWMPGPAAKMAGRFSQFAVAAAKMALADSGLDLTTVPSERVLVGLGSSMHGIVDVGEPTLAAFMRGETVAPWTCLEYPAHSATAHIAIGASARGQITTMSTACTAGLDAVGWASDQIISKGAAAVLAGASDAPLSPYSLAAFHSVGVLSQWPGPPEEASRPYDARRSGLVLAEGSAVVLLEDAEHAHARGARGYAEVLGWGSSSEALHLRKVDLRGATGARAMRLAIERANIEPDEVDYIAGHGNSLPDYDTAETSAIKEVFGKRAWNVPISSNKSMCGQALAASSAMQVVVSCLTIRDGVISPTINYQNPDAACDLDYVPNEARHARVRTVLIHARGMGGSHTAMVIRSAP
jgi:3-oxoacyl-[acyl-carrier-protein] synthase II